MYHVHICMNIHIYQIKNVCISISPGLQVHVHTGLIRVSTHIKSHTCMYLHTNLHTTCSPGDRSTCAGGPTPDTHTQIVMEKYAYVYGYLFIYIYHIHKLTAADLMHIYIYMYIYIHKYIHIYKYACNCMTIYT